MNISSILIMGLAAGALGAQEAPKLDGRVQLFAEISRPAQITVAQPSPAPDIKDQPKRLTGLGIRFLGEVAAHPGWYYELGGMFNSSSKFTFQGQTSTGSFDLTNIKFTESYWSLGAAYMAGIGENLTWGAHLEGRGEYLRTNGQAEYQGTLYDESKATTYLRPWVRGSFDYTFSGIGREQHPFIGLDASYALTQTTQFNGNILTLDNRTLKSMAPRASAALYAGIRF